MDSSSSWAAVSCHAHLLNCVSLKRKRTPLSPPGIESINKKISLTLIMNSGDRHINFWRIVTTSSGIKMDVTSGMFNNKPVTDIESFVQLGDGKVVTGCEWGNLLLWEKGKVGDLSP